MFGASKPAFGTYGSTGTSTSLFGTQQNKPVGVAFGTPQQSQTNQPTSSLFGTPATTSNMFGQSNTSGSLFGATNTNTTGSLFGQSAPAQQTSGGLFGGSAFGTPASTQPQGTAFGSAFGTANNTLIRPTTTGGMFGSTPTAATGGLFGSTGEGGGGTNRVLGAGVSGSAAKFEPLIGQDTMMKNSMQTSIQVKHQCITAMKLYEGKSVEELRVEDYLANRKGPQAGGTGAFGATNTAGGLFGQAATSTAPAGGLFGQTTQNRPLFGAAAPAATSSGGLFGGATSSGGLFGSTSTANKPLFGATTTTATTGFSFGSNTAPSTSGGGLFGSAAPKPAFGAPATGGLFGTAASTAPQTGSFAFGGQQQQAGGLFGAKTTGTGLFGASTSAAAPTTGFSFNAAPAASAFGQTSIQGGGLFGAKTTQAAATPFGGFGATQTSGAFGTAGFGGTSTAGGLFGAAPPKTGGLFSTPATGSSLFPTSQAPAFGGQMQQKQGTFNFQNTAPGGFSFAGNQPAQGGGLFGGQPSAQAVTIGTDPSTAATQQLLFEQQMRALAACPYGDTPLMKLLNNSDRTEEERRRAQPTDPAAQRRAMNQMESKYKPPVMSTGSPYFRSALANVSLGSPSLTRRLSMPRSTPRILTAINRNGSFRNDSRDTSFVDDLDNDESLIKKGFVPKKNPKKLVIRPKEATVDSPILPSPMLNPVEETPSILPATSRTLTHIDNKRLNQPAPPPLNLDATSDTTINNNASASDATVRTIRDTVQSNYQPVTSNAADTSIVDWNDESRIVSPPPQMMSPKAHPGGIVLRRQGYYTIPAMKELADITKDGKCVVKNGFTVGRMGYGTVFWPGETDVFGLNLDELVHFRNKEVTVYPDDGTKPGVGIQLNKPAEVTLDGVWPLSKTDKLPIKDLERLEAMAYRKRLEIAAARMDAVFIDYRPETGSWVFKVPHFTKYGLDEGDDDDVQKAINLDGTIDHVQRATVRKSPLKDSNLVWSGSNELAPPKAVGLGGMDVSTPDFIANEPEPNEFYDMDLMTPMDLEKGPIVPINSGKKVSQMKSAFFEESMNKEASIANAKQCRMSFLNGYDESKGKLDVVDQIARLYKKSAEMQDSLLSGDPYSQMYEDVSKYGFGESMAPISGEEEGFAEIRRKHEVPSDVDYSQRLMYNRSHMHIDAALFNNIRFRPAINKNLTYFTLPSGKEIIEPFQAGQKQIGTRMTRLDAYQLHTETGIQPDLYEYYMTLQLEYSEIMHTELEDGCPKIETIAGMGLLRKLAEPDTDIPKYDRLVWSLCWALWGDYPSIEDVDPEHVYAREMIRKEAVCNWLLDASQTQLQQTKFKSKSLDQTENTLSTCVLYMKYGRIAEAAELAAKAENPRLAMTIASACEPIARQLVHQQLLKWKDNGVDQFIDSNRMQLYVMCAGLLDWSTSDGRSFRICDQLSWTAAFAYHVHLVCASHSSLCDVLLTYEQSVNAGLAPKPTPEYICAGTQTNKLDVCYDLMQLYSDKAYPLAPLLDPSSHTNSLFDYHLGWHLWSVLHSLGYRYLSEHATSALHMGYAAQLHTEASLKWAATVIMHIHDQFRRDESIQDLLNVNLDKLDNEEMEFITQRLKIPDSRIATAKLIECGNKGNDEEEAWLLLEAKTWNKAHKRLIEFLGPLYIVNDNLDRLEEYIERLKDNVDRIRDWAVGADVFDKYLQCQHLLAAMRGNSVAENVVQEMKPIVLPLIAKISALRDTTPLQLLAQAEMSKMVCNLVYVLLSPDEVNELIPALNKLPMPENYTLDYCQLIVHNSVR